MQNRRETYARKWCKTVREGYQKHRSSIRKGSRERTRKRESLPPGGGTPCAYFSEAPRRKIWIDPHRACRQAHWRVSRTLVFLCVFVQIIVRVIQWRGTHLTYLRMFFYMVFPGIVDGLRTPFLFIFCRIFHDLCLRRNLKITQLMPAKGGPRRRCITDGWSWNARRRHCVRDDFHHAKNWKGQRGKHRK